MLYAGCVNLKNLPNLNFNKMMMNDDDDGIKTNQSEQATLSLPLRICQSTCRISDFRGPQLAET